MTNVNDATTTGGPVPTDRSRKRLTIVVLAIISVIALLLTGGAFAYVKQFDGKALPGTTVLGQDVSGKTPDEISQLVAERGEDVTVTVSADGTEHEATLTDLGVTVDAEATGQTAVERDDSFFGVLSAAWSGEHPVEPVVAVDEDAVTSYAKGLVPEDRTEPVDAQVVFDEDAQTWNAVPGQNGQGVDPQEMIETVTQKAPALESFTVEQPFEKISPSITTDEAEAVVGTINGVLEQPMSITGPEGKTHDVSSELRSSWLSVAPDESGQELVLAVDEEAVRDWVASRADKDSVKAKDGIEQVDAEGEVVKVVAEKRDGLELTNVDAVADELIAALKGASPLEVAFETKTVEAKVEQVKAPESEDDKKSEEDKDDKDKKKDEEKAPEPTGEKWIDVDLGAKTVTAYVGDTPVWGPRSIVDGKEGNETVTGSYEIYLRYEKQDMTNEAYYPEGHPKHYYNPDVPWVQYFHRGFGFHGAPWRSSFGYSGSHGCINMTVSDAKWLYDWASIGTRVEVHH